MFTVYTNRQRTLHYGVLGNRCRGCGSTGHSLLLEIAYDCVSSPNTISNSALCNDSCIRFS